MPWKECSVIIGTPVWDTPARCGFLLHSWRPLESAFAQM